jgi:hypothetical protein
MPPLHTPVKSLLPCIAAPSSHTLSMLYHFQEMDRVQYLLLGYKILLSLPTTLMAWDKDDSQLASGFL